jgi:GntR family transcriptional repressor for pyruvate dehydrogenase complex
MVRKSKLTRNALSDLVIERLHDMIWLGEVRPGEMMPPHTELAERFGVGLSTVREAIKALSHKGMVEVVPGRGTQVLPEALVELEERVASRTLFTCEEAGDVYEARRIIESNIAGKAAIRATKAEIEEIEQSLQEMIESQEDIDHFTRADMRFHLSVVRACKNKTFIQLYVLMQNMIEETLRESNIQPGGVERAIANRTELLTAIQEGDVIRALRASDQQITDAVERLLLNRDQQIIGSSNEYRTSLV